MKLVLTKNTNAGFSFIEVMVALVIVALLSQGVMRFLGDSTRNATYLQDKVLASLVAEYQLNFYIIHAEKNPAFTLDGVHYIEMNHRLWPVTQEITPLSSNIQKITIRVGYPQQPDSAKLSKLSQDNLLFELSGFFTVQREDA